MYVSIVTMKKGIFWRETVVISVMSIWRTVLSVKVEIIVRIVDRISFWRGTDSAKIIVICMG